MALWEQLLLFGIPGLVLFCGFHYWTPKLTNKGVPLILSFWFFLWMPVIILLPLSILLYWLGGGSMIFADFKERFHLVSFSSTDWLWVVGAVIFTIVADQLLEPVGKYFARLRYFSPPSYLPAPFNPLKKFEIPPNKFFWRNAKRELAIASCLYSNTYHCYV